MGGALFLERPVFGVELQLRVPAVVISPSLDEIQAAINDTAKKVDGHWLRCGHSVAPRVARRVQPLELSTVPASPCTPTTPSPPPHIPAQVLQVAKGLRMWSAEEPEATYYDLLSKDSDIVKVGWGCSALCRALLCCWAAALCPMARC